MEGEAWENKIASFTVLEMQTLFLLILMLFKLPVAFGLPFLSSYGGILSLTHKLLHLTSSIMLKIDHRDCFYPNELIGILRLSAPTPPLNALFFQPPST